MDKDRANELAHKILTQNKQDYDIRKDVNGIFRLFVGFEWEKKSSFGQTIVCSDKDDLIIATKEIFLKVCNDYPLDDNFIECVEA